ncbi:fibulin-5-like [Pitangus sulphuratus]|nr:fibulin-5-like [Pitangus sulphuratus]
MGFETVITRTLIGLEMLKVTEEILKTQGCSPDKDQNHRIGRNKAFTNLAYLEHVSSKDLSSKNYKQQCTNGFDLDRASGQCIDIDECRTIPEACRGDMVCVNQNGGYLCVPRTNPVYRSPYLNPYSNIYPPPPAPGPVPNYPTVTRPLMCRFGFQLDENNQCAGK